MTTDDRTLRASPYIASVLWTIPAAFRRWFAVQIARAESANPFESTLLVACVMAGSTHVLGLGQPSLMDAALGKGWGIAWASLLAGSSAVAFVGVLWRGSPATALQLEWIGLCGLAGALLSVAAAAATHSVLVGGIAGPISGALALGAVWRIAHIAAAFRRAVRATNQVMRKS